MERVVICGAGFGGLELSSLLHEQFADRVETTLIDANPTFTFGFSKLQLMFGEATMDEIRLPYSAITKPSVTFKQERITSIDPQLRRVTTDRSSYDADILVIALGADYDPAATPGLGEAGYEYYSIPGAERARRAIADFTGGRALIAICAPAFKCPPAPFETAFLLEEHLRDHGLRETSSITVTSPLPAPIPISASTSEAIVSAMDERGIDSRFKAQLVEIDPGAKVAIYKDGAAIDFDLLLAVPLHVAPAVLEGTGLLQDGLVAVDPKHMYTPFDGVYAVGDCSNAPVPRAGVFAEGQARAAFDHIAAKLRGEPEPAPYPGRGVCYLDFGFGEMGKVDADFLSGPQPVAPLVGPSRELAPERHTFFTERRDRWFS